MDRMLGMAGTSFEFFILYLFFENDPKHLHMKREILETLHSTRTIKGIVFTLEGKQDE